MMNCYHLWWTCGPYKACAAELMADFLREHQKEREIARERLSEYDSLGGWFFETVAMRWCWHLPAHEGVYMR